MSLEAMGKVIELTRLACGAEAVAHGFPDQAGYDMFEGICADDIEGWDAKTFLDWTKEMDKKYDPDSTGGVTPLMELYKSCSVIIGSYAETLKQASQS